MSEQLGKGSHA